MDASEARKLTTVGLERLIDEDNEQARLAEIQAQEHTKLIEQIAQGFHDEIDALIKEAASSAKHTVEFVYEEPEPLGDEPNEAELAHYEDIEEAYGMLADTLEQEKFSVAFSAVNLQSFKNTHWSRYERHLVISWREPKPVKKNVFHKFLGSLAHTD